MLEDLTISALVSQIAVCGDPSPLRLHILLGLDLTDISPTNSKKLWELHCSIPSTTELSLKEYVD
jgi:hypothetical protein